MKTRMVCDGFSTEEQLRANRIARFYGSGKATGIVRGERDRVVKIVSNGYYVPYAYLRNFGWKNTYYQKMVVIVEIDGRG